MLVDLYQMSSFQSGSCTAYGSDMGYHCAYKREETGNHITFSKYPPLPRMLYCIIIEYTSVVLLFLGVRPKNIKTDPPN